MNTTRDWEAARRDLLEDGRTRVGPPPDYETVEALLRGELPEAQAQRVREVLAYYPELVQVMTASAPSEGEAVLTDAERDADFARIRQRLAPAPAPPVELRPRRERSRLVALAAGIIVAVLLGSLALSRLLSDPRALTTKVLIADNDRVVRGGPSSSAIVLAPDTRYLLKPLFRPARAYPEYRLELLDINTTPPQEVWERNGIERQRDGSFPAEMSTDDLKPGEYRLVLSGIDEGPENLATYTVRVDSR